MGLFESPQQKWIKQKHNKNWYQMFSNFSEIDVIMTKCMFYQCCDFADNLLGSGLFKGQNMALRIYAMAYAKMYFYHMVTKSPTAHNLFYGYLHELYTNFYHEDLDSANLAVDTLRSTEKWYIQYYYEFFDNHAGNWQEVKKHFYNYIKSVKSEGSELFIGSDESLDSKATELLSQMLFIFTLETK